jgi:hypothetical protein
MLVKDFMRDMLDFECTLLDHHKSPWRSKLGSRVKFYMPIGSAATLMGKMNSRDSINEQFISNTKSKLIITADFIMGEFC